MYSDHFDLIFSPFYIFKPSQLSLCFLDFILCQILILSSLIEFKISSSEISMPSLSITNLLLHKYVWQFVCLYLCCRILECALKNLFRYQFLLKRLKASIRTCANVLPCYFSTVNYICFPK